MEKLKLSEIAAWTGGELLPKEAGARDAGATGVSTDSRTLKKGDLFFAIRGENFDGHRFVLQAFKAGACGAVVSGPGAYADGSAGPVIRVKDTVEALKSAASSYALRFKGLKTIGITGSNGKTTTKDITAQVLGRKFKTLKSEGSFNNAIGLPLTLFKLDPTHEAAVLEYGTNHEGEIRALARVAAPDIAVITNIGRTHLQYFGAREEVLKEKFNLVLAVKKGGTAVLNADDGLLKEAGDKYKGGTLMTFWIKEKADVRGSVLEAGEGSNVFRLELGGASEKVAFPLPGTHNIYNALAAASIAAAMGLTLREIRAGLEAFETSSPHRLERREKDGVTVIDDTYNANPESVTEGLKVLSASAGRRIAVLGDMAELGSSAARLHMEVGKTAGKLRLASLVCVGEMSRNICFGALEEGMDAKNVVLASSNKEAAEAVKKLVRKGDTVLVKGSRRMKMEEIVSALTL